MIPYDIAAALATAAANLADTLDDGRDDCRSHYSAYIRVLLDLLDTDHMADDPHTAAIITRAIEASWFTIGDTYNYRGEFASHSVTPAPDGWTDPREPSAELRSFLQSARLDVLTLAAEIRRLRTMCATDQAAALGGWSCVRCGAAWFGTAPDDGLCPDRAPSCQPQ